MGDDKPELYADRNHVVESIREAASFCTDGFTLRVVDTIDVVMVAETRESLEERNVWGVFDFIDDVPCRLDCRIVTLGSHSSLNVELKFHENVVERPIEIMPAGPRAIGADQATDPAKLGEALYRALNPIVEEWDPIFTFAEVSAASMASGGHYTDFEYEYSVDGISV